MPWLVGRRLALQTLGLGFEPRLTLLSRLSFEYWHRLVGVKVGARRNRQTPTAIFRDLTRVLPRGCPLCPLGFGVSCVSIVLIKNKLLLTAVIAIIPTISPSTSLLNLPTLMISASGASGSSRSPGCGWGFSGGTEASGNSSSGRQ